VLEDFTKATGIKVKCEPFDSNDMLERSCSRGAPATTLWCRPIFSRQVKAGVFKLDRASCRSQ
jgi:spermidine/putrescine-binding protein